MMGIKNYRSEEERLCSLLDETEGPYPLLTHDDPVIFHNPAYERELFLEYNMDFDGESTSSPPQHHQQNDEEPIFLKQEEPTWIMSPSEAEDPSAFSPIQHQKPKMMSKHYTQPSRFNPYSSGPLIKEPCNGRTRRISSHSVYRSESPPSKRGRPSKATSTTKMANYARNYREQKKNEMATMHMRNEELEAEVKLLQVENQRMKNALSQASEEINRLKKVIDQDSQIARVVANMGTSSSSAPDYSLGARAGVCVHVGSLGTTVEVCKHCADNNQTRLDAKYQKFESSCSDMQLFNGDFSVFDNYLNNGSY